MFLCKKRMGAMLSILISFSLILNNSNNFIVYSDEGNKIKSYEKDIKADDILEITLNEGEFVPDLSKNQQKYKRVNVKTLGNKQLENLDYTRLSNSNIPIIDLSQSSSESIPARAFKNLSSLIGFYFPYDLKVIGDGLFQNCINLKEDLIIPNTVVDIGKNVFNGCSSLGNIFIRVNEGDKETNYRKTVIDSLPNNSSTIIDLPYDFNESGTWLDNTPKTLGKPILKDVVNGVETDLVNNIGTKVSLKVPVPYNEADIKLFKNNECIDLPIKNSEDKYIFEDKGFYKVIVTTYLKNVSIIDFQVGDLSYIEDAVKKAEETKSPEDIEFARDLVNGMPDMIEKDDFHNRLDNIFPNMNIERDNKTYNVDLYIKTKNSISISLNTNAITFNEFSGTENIEQLNALKITVSSSLPYELNAYLPEKIKEIKDSSIMEEEVLNIKESSNEEYQEFKGVKEKLVLKDNNESGDNIEHNIDLMLKGGVAYKLGIYKATIKLEVQQI